MKSLVALLFLLSATGAMAQAPGVAIERGAEIERDEGIMKIATELREAGKLASREQVKEMVEKPEGGAVDLPAPQTARLTPPEIAAKAKKGYVRIGWLYLCPRCDHWHLNLAGGYAIDGKGTVATCDHCVRGDLEMREGYLIAVDDEEKVYPVKGVLAASKDMDVALLRVEGGHFEPLALQDQIVPGDAAFLYSEPFGHAGYFSTGIVNRFYWNGDAGDPMKLEDAKRLRVNVSTDWAPGSSGAAVLDASGNVIGHVSRIETRGAEGKGKQPGQTMIAFREAIPARAVMLLANPPKE